MLLPLCLCPKALPNAELWHRLAYIGRPKGKKCEISTLTMRVLIVYNSFMIFPTKGVY